MFSPLRAGVKRKQDARPAKLMTEHILGPDFCCASFGIRELFPLISSKSPTPKAGQFTLLLFFQTADTSATAAWVTISVFWYQKPDLNVHEVTYRKQTSHTIHFNTASIPAPLIANPVSSRAVVNGNGTPPPPTRTIGQRTAYNAILADVRSLASGIQTDEQLQDLRARLDEIQLGKKWFMTHLLLGAKLFHRDFYIGKDMLSCTPYIFPGSKQPVYCLCWVLGNFRH
ncbi:hypothetical protein B0H12DRAFT_1078242 [Mycena haematopus]|nr:hypothetical protein B0H12DRAFT_1078242 [Mycena haematopus]